MEKVLIVDDEPKVCQLICELIDWRALNMEIVGTANDGIKALDMVREFNPDIIVTDIRMPGYDGLELINRITGTGKDAEVVIISGYSQFEYAQMAIKYGVSEYLLKPIKKEELYRTILKIQGKFRQKKELLTKEEQLKIRLQSDTEKLRLGFIAEILSDKGVSAEQASIENINEGYHFNFQAGCFMVAAVKIDCNADHEKCFSIMKSKTVQILNSLLKPKCFDMDSFSDESTVYCVMNFEKEAQKSIRKQLKVVLDELLIQGRLFNELKITIGVGSAANEINQLKSSFDMANFAIKERLLAGTGKLVEDVAIYENHVLLGTLLAKLHKSMSAALDILDKASVLAIIDSVKAEVLSQHQLSGQEIYQLVKEICSIYLLSMRNSKIEIVNSGDFYTAFCSYADHCGTVRELFKLLSGSIGDSLEGVIEEKKQEVTKPIRTAKKYIQGNYMNPISLEEVSEIVGFNASYFSTLFKKETGSNFLEYLTKVRMDKAKELLKETKLSVSAICEEVGYNDLKHFTKSFSKVAGIKPNEYRKLYS